MSNQTNNTQKTLVEKIKSKWSFTFRDGIPIPQWVFFAFLATGFAFFIIGGSFTGYFDGQGSWKSTATVQANYVLAEQYLLALQDIENQQYEIAKQRLEFILQNDDFVPAVEALIEISVLTGKTATPTSLPATVTPTATLDTRPAEELFQQAQTLFNQQQWQIALETLSGLRQANPNYKISKVDGMMYAALRNRGVDKILKYGELESGLYDFTLSEQFGPLDIDAQNYMVWARLYLTGNGFWFAYPEIAIYYYGQVVNIAPNLKDTSGQSAFYRYWASLMHFGDALFKEEDWCGAALQYGYASAARSEQNLSATEQVAIDLCIGPSDTPTPTITATFTVTPTFTASATGIFFTDTPTLEFSPSPTLAESATPTATFTESPIPADSDTPTATFTATETPTPTATFPPTPEVTP